ncbi:hypothetical protein O1V13_23580 [Delftia acidovorans]|nr:hypothetical protein [Delftia acidovorans]WAT88650.1 hypothetical protein O1V13_23580 [Delftia acidovorans]
MRCIARRLKRAASTH